MRCWCPLASTRHIIQAETPSFSRPNPTDALAPRGTSASIRHFRQTSHSDRTRSFWQRLKTISAASDVHCGRAEPAPPHVGDGASILQRTDCDGCTHGTGQNSDFLERRDAVHLVLGDAACRWRFDGNWPGPIRWSRRNPSLVSTGRVPGSCISLEYIPRGSPAASPGTDTGTPAGSPQHVEARRRGPLGDAAPRTTPRRRFAPSGSYRSACTSGSVIARPQRKRDGPNLPIARRRLSLDRRRRPNV